MKQRIKKENNNRRKSLFGLDDAVVALIAAGITAATTVGTSIYSNEQQKKRAREQQRKQLLMDNEANAMEAAANQSQALNYDQNNELETLKTGTINSLSSQESQFRCGGKKRMKRSNGGTVTSNINKLKLYI